MELYSAVILGHSRDPHGIQIPDEIEAQCTRTNPTCGDRITLYLGAGAEIAHQTRGCAVCVASASMLTRAMSGASRDERERLLAEAIAYLHGADDVAPFEEFEAFAPVRDNRARVRCAALPWEALEVLLPSPE